MRNYLRSKGRCWQLKLKVDFNFPDDYHTLFASGNKELNFVISKGYFSNTAILFQWELEPSKTVMSSFTGCKVQERGNCGS